MTGRAALLLLLHAVAAGTPGRAQTMSVTPVSVDLPSPDTLAYDAGLSPAGTFSVLVTACAGALGCRVTIENPGIASPVPIALEWRLVLVSQVGDGTLGCAAQTAFHLWQPLPASPADVMDTGTITEPDTACVAALEVRAAGLSYAQHQFTSPPTTYWRELLFRAVEK